MMRVKLEIGKTYTLTHPKTWWKGSVKVVGYDENDNHLVEIVKFHHATPGVIAWFEKKNYLEDAVALNLKTDWTVLEDKE